MREQAVIGETLKGVKSRCAMYPGRLKRRMWFDTAHRLRYTLTRFPGGEVRSRGVHQAGMKQIIDPGGPFGADDAAALDEFADGVVVIVQSG